MKKAEGEENRIEAKGFIENVMEIEKESKH